MTSIMPALIVKRPGCAPEDFPLGRLRITIGRSARNDLCIPDPFASRVHAEVRREGDQYSLHDLGSANGTFCDNAKVEGSVALVPGRRIQIGETTIEFSSGANTQDALATMIADAPARLPEAVIHADSTNRTTSGLLEAIEGVRTQSDRSTQPRTVEHSDLLALISKVSVTLLASASLDETLRQVAALVFDAVPADRCLIMLRDKDGEQPGALQMRVSSQRERTRSDTGNVRISRTIIEEVVERGDSVLTSDAQHDPRFMSGTMAIDGIRSVLAVPLSVGSQVIGMIYADSPLVEVKFTREHLDVLRMLASVAAIRVENARLAEEQRDRERFEQELQLAREIQQRFQPTASPVVPGYDMLGISFPCYEIGGDYYDFIARDDGRTVIALGDVSGKGTSAALLMSSLHAAVHAQVSSHQSIVKTIEAVNRYLAETIPANRFVTLFYAELDPVTGALAFLNAGHNPPLIVHAAGTVEQLAAGGIPLGIQPDARFRAGQTQLQPGDALVIYSDGVSETANRQGEEFGWARLHEVVARNLDASAASLRDRIEAALTKFAGGTPAVDDVTLVIVKRNK